MAETQLVRVYRGVDAANYGSLIAERFVQEKLAEGGEWGYGGGG
jgi:hypothetical protein